MEMKEGCVANLKKRTTARAHCAWDMIFEIERIAAFL